MTSRAWRRALQAAAAALVLLALYFGRFRSTGTVPSVVPRSPPPVVPPPTSPVAPPAAHAPAGISVTEAFRSRRSRVEVQTGGRVVRLLPDDRQGSPHERVLLRVEGGTTVLVAHNLALAPRVPVAVGDSVELRGEYEWNPKGGVIHWTHRDPEAAHEAGWIRYQGRLYQ